MKRRKYIVVMMMSLLLGSCSSEDILSVPNGNGRIRFDVGVSQSEEVAVTPMNGGATRSAEPLFLPTSSIEMRSGDMKMYANCASSADIPMHNIIPETTTRGSIQTSDNFYSDFGLFGYFYDNSKSWAANGSSLPIESSMNNLNVTRTNNSWTTNVNWPGASKNAKFFAYAPYKSIVTLENTLGAPKISYTVPSKIANQQDLLVAKSATDILCNGNTEVALNFTHVLSAIKFVKGDTPGYNAIKEIIISGVRNQGTLNMDSQSWESVSGSDTYTISPEDEVCFLMPQTAPSGAKLSVTFTDGTTERTFEADIANTTWEVGYQYTYSLSINKITGEFIFEVNGPSESVSAEGGVAAFTVKSYYHNDTQDIPIAWQAKNAEGTVILSGDGGTTTITTDNINIDANTHKKNLQAVQIGTETDYHDLSYDYNRVKRWTANCYVVNGWGYFKLPLVYGNAIKDGITNSDAYTAVVDDAAYCTSTDFCNRNGTAITDETIKITRLSSSGSITAKVEWQYVNDLEETNMVTIDEITNKSGYYYLNFHIDKAVIDQGNALISVSDKDGVLWSWHIWVTDMPWKETNTYTDGTNSYSFMKMPLGMVDNNPTSAPRILNYSFSQTHSNGKSVVASINQEGVPYPTNTTCTFYQWGRKDPFKPESITGEDGNKSYADAIKNPTVFYKGSTSNYDWSSGHSYQLWNAGNTSASTNYTSTKTIYDPCPPGFKVAPQQAYKIMVDNCEGFNWDSSASGRKCSSTSDYWRAFGFLAYNSGSLAGAGTDGYCWSAGPSSDVFGYYLYFSSSGNANPTSSISRAAGLSVRPVSE